MRICNVCDEYVVLNSVRTEVQIEMKLWSWSGIHIEFVEWRLAELTGWDCHRFRELKP